MYLEKLSLKGRTAVVTGGGRAIGLAICGALAEAGAHVIIADRDPRVAEEGKRVLAGKGFVSEVVLLDVTDPGAVTAAADSLAATGRGADILVCNAGIVHSEVPAESMSDTQWMDVINVNLNGLFWCCRAFGRHMLEAGRGSIVNIGSMSGFIVNKPQGQCSYNASKAGVHHLTKSLAAEWASRGVRVNAVAPTYIDTPLNEFVRSNPAMYDAWIGGTPMARVGTVDEIASVVHFLASDAASLMTGSVVVVDGGYTCW
jgi:NAD(P)-dependent dehydrogenase (short-subunit alcohol dehydrogenase family)